MCSDTARNHALIPWPERNGSGWLSPEVGRHEKMCYSERKRKIENTMYTYYVLRGTQADKPVELEGEIDEEQCPGVDLNVGPALLSYLAVRADQDAGSAGNWEEAELTDAFFDREDSYIFFTGRWMRRSDAPWRKDRTN